jgi:hypothetical protein
VNTLVTPDFTFFSKTIGVNEKKIKFRINRLLSSRLVGQIVGKTPEESYYFVETNISNAIRKVLTAYPTLDLARTLAGNRFEVFRLLTEKPRTKKEIQKSTGLSLPTLQRILQNFRNKGLVVLTKRHYVLRKEVEPIIGLVQAIYLNVLNWTIETSFPQRRTFQYLGDGRFIVATLEPDAPKGYHRTAFDRFSDFGVNVLGTNVRYYASFNPTINQILAHAIAFASWLAPNSTAMDTRSFDAVVAFIRKNKTQLDFERVREELKQDSTVNRELDRALVAVNTT